MIEAYIGLGGNLGDRLENLSEALGRIEELPDTTVLRVSRACESEPWGVTDQPPFANAVALVRTALDADAMLEWLKQIEEDLGREPGVRFGPRSVDLDILLFGDEEWDSPALTIPHPRMLERDFVVRPLLELAPGVTLPDGRRIADLREGATAGRVCGDLGPIPGFGGPPTVDAPRGASVPEAEPLVPDYGEDGIDDDVLEAAEEAAREAPEPGATGDEWGPDEEWVPVLMAAQGMLMPTSSAMDLINKQNLLSQAGVPSELYPAPVFSRPGTPYYAAIEEVRLLVPASRLAEAREVLGLPPGR